MISSRKKRPQLAHTNRWQPRSYFFVPRLSFVPCSLLIVRHVFKVTYLFYKTPKKQASFISLFLKIFLKLSKGYDLINSKKCMCFCLVLPLLVGSGWDSEITLSPGFIRDHSYITSSHFWDFWTPLPPPPTSACF